MKYIFLGVQGSGKSTQAKLVSEKFNLPYIEMGQVLRDKIADGSQEASEIKQAMETGNLVSDEITVRTLKEKLEKPEFEKGFILDGYPRNQAQFEGLPEGIDRVFYIKIPDEEAVKRLSQRAREDDSQEIIKKRIEIFHNETEPLLAKFREKGILEEIDGTPPIPQVTKDLFSKLENGASQNR